MAAVIEEQLLGFDARALSSSSAWESGRRDQFLLRPDVRAPLSTDTLVWPSVWQLTDVPLPSWIGMNAGLWESLPAMREHLAKAVEDVFEFRTLTDARVAEHAPFFVLGLYWIEGDGPA